MIKIILAAGARPNFMKIAPIIRAINQINQTNQRKHSPF
jgi:UDP-N-acetylglucosamine 2-epimerase